MTGVHLQISATLLQLFCVGWFKLPGFILKGKNMKAFLIALMAVSLLTACSFSKPHEKNLAKEAEPLGLAEAKTSVLDSVFISDRTALTNYKQVILEPLDLSAVKIRKPSNINLAYDTPWELNDQDRKFYQERYQLSMKKQWLDKSGLTKVDQASTSTVKVKATLLEIAPLGSKDDSKGRPTMTKVYSEGMGTMTLKIEISDATSGKVLALISDQRDLGKIWEENNRVSFNQKVRLAFDAWARNLQKELM
jgi:Protein of unknown function (DUF3313)